MSVYQRKSFEYEKELRAAICTFSTKYTLDKPEFTIGTYIHVDLDILIETVVVAPDSPVWFTKLVESIVKKYNLKKDVIQSDLNKDPLF